MRTIDEIIESHWDERETQWNEVDGTSYTPSQIEEMMKEYALEVLNIVTNSPYIEIDNRGLYVNNKAVEELKKQIREQ